MTLKWTLLLHQLKATVRRTDWTLVLATTGLAIVGILFIWGGSFQSEPTEWGLFRGDALRQSLWLVVGLAVMTVALLLPYRYLAHYGYTLYVLAVGALLYLAAAALVHRWGGPMLPLAPEIRHAHRWIDLGPVTVQPAEFAKVAFIIALAKYVRYKESYRRWWGLLPPFALAAVPMLLVALEPDLGSALVFAPVALALLYVAGAQKKHLLIYAAAPLAAGALLWLLGIQLLAPYQHDRLLAFLNPERYARGPGYQLLQSVIAVGSGGLWGKGLGQGTQGQLGFLPARETDFIFASIAEDWGLAGAAAVLALYVYLLIGAVSIARRTRDPFGRLLVVGVMTLVATQALINTAMTVRLAPVTGLPLPFISQGGSSLVTNFIALGILLNVGARPTAVLSREDFQ
jgi:rod shape determining protein RodA